MTHLLARIGLATLIAAGTLAGLAPVAHADELSIEFGSRPRYFEEGPRYSEDGPRYGGDFAPRRHHRWRDGERMVERGGCFPGEAVAKARYQGLRHPRIGRISPRVVVVNGRSRYGWERMVFANVRGCPVISD